MIMTGVSLVLTGMLTPSYTLFIRNATEISDDPYTYESDDVRMAKISKELEFLDVHFHTEHG